MALTPDSVIHRPMTTRVRRFRGQVYVANSEKGFELDDVSTLALRHVNGRRTIAEIAAAVAGDYDVDVSTVTDDLIEIFGDLVGEGVLSDQPTDQPVRRGEA